MVVGLATASLAGHPQCSKGVRILWGYMGIMEKKMGTIGVIGTIQRLYRVILGLHADNGEENGNYYNGLCGSRN